MTTSAPATKQDLDDLFSRLSGRFATKDDLKTFATKDDLKAFATKDDLQTLPTFDDVEKIVARVVSEVVEDAMQTISSYLDEKFAAIDERFSQMEARMDRIEDKLDRTAALVDLHSVDIRQLKRKLA